MKIILFDIDETLLSCKGDANAKGSEKMFREVFQIDANEEMINHTGKTEKANIETIIRLVKGLSSDQEVEIPNKAYQVWAEGTGEVLKNYPPLVLPGIKELLESLTKDPNIIIGLQTGNSRLRSEIKLKAARLDKFFMTENKVLAGAFGDISNKRADLIPEAKAKYGKGTYIVIDDSIVAGKMTKESDTPAILVATGKATEEELKQCSDYVFKDFGENRWQEVIKIINGLPG